MTESPSSQTPAGGPAGDEDAGPLVTPPADAVETAETGEAGAPADEAGGFAAQMAEAVGSDDFSEEFGTLKIRVEPDRWVEAVTTLRDEGLDFFSYLSAIDWSREVAVGDPVESPDDLDERYEVLCRLSTVVDDRGVTLSTDLPKAEPALDSLVGVFGGAAWHEREAHEMFGIDFRGHPRLIKLYLPDAFEGFPLRKSYPLLSREVKPWPGLVDVEGMPSEENTEAGEASAGGAAAGDAAGAEDDDA